MSDCSSCPSKGKCGSSSESCGKKNNPLNKVKKIVGVMSGKGGVGKSTISAMLVKELNKRGFKVGLLDADITGPSAVRLMGLQGERAYGDGEGNIIPAETPDGIKVMSLNLMMEDENQPVVWRGAMLSNCVKQFWEETLWGELDYLVIDMPPGTGDVTLTVMQSIPLSGIIMVSLPQDMVGMIVTKSLNMARMLNIPVYGLVQNMSYVKCPHCDEKIRIYGDSTSNIALEQGIPLLGELPANADIAKLSQGKGEISDKEVMQVFDTLVKTIG
ncbi:MAG: Mrp/NBP35 family ATP-binding protein [Firmicutes bacterium]|nr:Mrp/NBP35 family ATP-binding protein [Bacillota bacterium]